VREVRRLGPAVDAGSPGSGGTRAEVTLHGSSSLQADELLEMATRLEPKGFPSCLAASCAGVAGGLAVWRGSPVLCIDPGKAVPPALVDPTTTIETLARGESEDVDAT
jgi:hypothetical protein